MIYKFYILIIFLIFGGSQVFSQESEPLMPSSESVYYPFDITILPGVSLLHKYPENKKVKHGVSINFTGGCAERLRVDSSIPFELGILWNYNRKNSEGIQIAGLVNMSGRNFGGLQIASSFNINGGRFDGIQFAGLGNFSGSRSNSLSAAGLVNISGGDRTEGILVSGLLNLTGSFRAGIMIAPFNYGERIYGVPVGIVSYSKKFGLGLDMWTDELKFLNIGLRSGNEKFYNTPFISLSYGKSSQAAFGLILGARWLFAPDDFKDYFNRTGLDFDLVVQGIINNINDINSRLNMINRFRIMFEYQSNQYLSFYAGPALNLHISATTDDEFYYPLQIYSYDETCECGTILKYRLWIGLNAGFRYVF